MYQSVRDTCVHSIYTAQLKKNIYQLSSLFFFFFKQIAVATIFTWKSNNRDQPPFNKFINPWNFFDAQTKCRNSVVSIQLLKRIAWQI